MQINRNSYRLPLCCHYTMEAKLYLLDYFNDMFVRYYLDSRLQVPRDMNIEHGTAHNSHINIAIQMPKTFGTTIIYNIY